ncbi:MAG: RNA polymerase sigma-70 factor [Mucilaginibacter sp.]|uniref:RNA polymerase sigma-70 factor n=1 Tax=Mucilaginibacter sp. TaxID=1882438 RepID=UPI003266BE9C
MELSKTPTDEELILLIAKDNTIAFKMLYNRYWKKMLAKAYGQLRSYTLAEEVVQDAFINLWKRRHTITLKYTFHTYIASVVRYEVMTQLAKKNKQPLYIDDLEIPAVADNATQQWLDFDELKLQIESLVDTLPDKCRLVFKLSRDKGLSDKQIAENLAISSKTVEAHISKALKTLRLSLNNFLCLTLFSCVLVYLAGW